MKIKLFELVILILLNINILSCFLIFIKEKQLKIILLKSNNIIDKEFFLTNSFIVNGIFVIEASYYFAGLSWLRYSMSTHLEELSQLVLYLFIIAEYLRNIFFIVILCFILIKINTKIKFLKKGKH